jgi:hypothetical protein
MVALRSGHVNAVYKDAGVAAAPLSVVLPVRDGPDEVAGVLEALLPQARRTGAEVLLVGRDDGTPIPDGVVHVAVEDPDIYRLRMVGVREAKGAVIAIGEDHAIPQPDWCEAVIRAHEENPTAAAVAGCLVNATDSTLSGRANFLAFAAPWTPPMPALPGDRPPPTSALSFKREAIAELRDEVGALEAQLMQELFASGRVAADDRIRVDHHQDHGWVWAVRNSFWGSRASYGFLRRSLAPRERVRRAGQIIRWMPGILWREARTGQRRAGSPARDLVLVAAIIAANTAGGVVGLAAGPGRSADLVA